MPAPRVFVSMGTPYTPAFAQFRDDLETMLRDRCGVDPRIIGKNEHPAGSPLTHIKSVMGDCAGVIVVAYERKFLETGTEKRGSAAPLKLVKNIYTTPWNHIESAMAYSLGLPLYIFCQRGLAEEGLIESKIDWYVQHVDMTPGSLSKPEIIDSVRAWVDQRVIPKSKKRIGSMAALRGAAKFSEMTPHELLAFGGMLLAAFAAGATAATYFPGLTAPFIHH
jgi:hypothetical protein